MCQPGDTLLSMSLSSGGHLTHGASANFSGKLYNFVHYDLDSNGYIDYEDIARKAEQYHPKVIVAGASAYSRTIDFERIKEIAFNNYAYFMVDMAHIAGLIATGFHKSPFGLADVITTTTHKTLRGPRGGMIFCKPELATKVDSAVFPGTQGGPLMHVIAGKAVAAEEALDHAFKSYIKNVILNSKSMAKEFMRLGYKVVTDGTDNHMFLIDLSPMGITGKAVQDTLDVYNITVNKNAVPGDKRSPQWTSGVRIGTAAMTTLGWQPTDFMRCADNIDEIITQKIVQRS
jgi:glycine hydroxymethyltransferase